MLQCTKTLQDQTTVDEIRGIEGHAASLYFGVFDSLIGTNKEHFFFRQRSRRPPLDNMSALLSFLYMLLVHDVRSACWRTFRPKSWRGIYAATWRDICRFFWR